VNLVFLTKFFEVYLLFQMHFLATIKVKMPQTT